MALFISDTDDKQIAEFLNMAEIAIAYMKDFNEELWKQIRNGAACVDGDILSRQYQLEEFIGKFEFAKENVDIITLWG